MDYNSVAEIYEEIDSTREKLLRAVEDLDDGQHGFRPSPERWSIAEIIEHLSIVEGQVARLLEKLLSKAEAGGHTRAEGSTFAPVTIAEQVEQTREQKLTAPEQIRPTGVPISDALAALRASRTALRSMRPRLERLEGANVIFPHPAFGPINIYQWLAFVGAHEARHLAQIEALKETLSVERGAMN
ncbi:MAG: DinB family protein [Rubrivivax sp.]|nr:DinB family protein [Pyrinomonadaceae bacterium]